MIPIKKVMNLAMEQEGDDYVFGAEADPNDPDPDKWDCSELVQWACDRAGVRPPMPDGAIYQYRHCREHSTLIPVRKGLVTYGALLFRITPAMGNHVAFSLGNGKTFEARGRAYGVGSWSAESRFWTGAALIPGVDYEEAKDA